MSRVVDHLRSQSVAYVAVLVALATGGGAAYATGLVTSQDIKNDTVRSVDLNMPIGAKPSELDKAVPLTGGFQTILRTTVSPDDGGGLGVAQAVAEMHNTSGKAAQVRLRLIHVGAPGQTRTFSVYLPAGTTTTAPGMIVIRGLGTGKQTFLLKASAPDGVAIDVVWATLLVAGYPTGGGFYPTGGGF
jgi:hypothetical protein